MEILVKAVDATNPDAQKDARGCYKRGMPVVVKPDGHEWGLEERLPRFVVIKFPLISVAAGLKYIQPNRLVESDPNTSVGRRIWQVRWADLPLAARNKLASTGELIIRAGSYNGVSDYTWAQVKSYFRNLQTGEDETADLT